MVFSILRLRRCQRVGDGIRTSTFPTMDMCFVGNKTIHAKRKYSLEEIAAFDILTFSVARNHVGLLDLFRAKRIQPRKVHTISSISAMLQLGRVVSAWQRCRGSLLSAPARVAISDRFACTTALLPLPIHFSYRLIRWH